MLYDHAALVTLAAPMSGSPFAVSTTELESLYSKYYRFEELARKDVIDHPASFQMRGLKPFEEVVW